MSRKLTVVVVVAALASVAVVGRAISSRLSTGPRGLPVYQVVAESFTRTVNAEGTLRPVKASAVTAPGDGRSLLIAWMADDGATVKKGDVLIRFDKNDAVRALADGKDDERAALSRIAKERQVIDGAVSDRARAAALTKVEIDHARRLGKKDPRFFPRTEVIESEIDEALLGARLTKTEAAQQAEEELGETRVKLLAVDRHKAELQRAEADRTLSSLEVRAPHDGTFVVQRMGWAQRMLQTGDRAYPGMRIGEVATTERMEAEVMVLEADAGGLVPGKSAQVVLEARPDERWKAKVKKVDPFPKTRHPEVPTQYFGAILSIDGKTAGLKPGQRLRATIAIDEIARALVVPRQAVATREAGSFVERLRPGGGFESIPVELGPSTVGRVVVVKGLSAGDRIALRDTTRSADETLDAKGRPGGSSGTKPAGRAGRP